MQNQSILFGCRTKNDHKHFEILRTKTLKPDVSFLTFLLNIDNMDIMSELNNANTFEERMQIALKNIDQTNFNVDLTKESVSKLLVKGFKMLWNRIEKMLEYQPSIGKQLNTIMYLLRPSTCSLDDDCGLCGVSIILFLQTRALSY